MITNKISGLINKIIIKAVYKRKDKNLNEY